MEYRILSVTLTEGLRNELDKLVDIEGIFTSRSEALRHGALLAVLLTRSVSTMEELKGIPSRMNEDNQRSMPVTLPMNLIDEIDRLVDIEHIFLSRSDVLRHGARMVLMLANGMKNFDEVRKRWKSLWQEFHSICG